MSKIKTLLLNLPWIVNNRLGVRAGSRWPFTCLPEVDGHIHYIPFPFFLAYAASLLKKYEKPALLIDAIAQEIDSLILLKEIAAYQPQLIIIETATASFENDLKIIQQIKKQFPKIEVGLCGPHASAQAQKILAQYSEIAYVLVKEYEETLLELVQALEWQTDLALINGLGFRIDSCVRINRLRQTIQCLDDLPWPERLDVPIYKYNDGFANMPVPNAQMWSSRGCPFNCTFCLWPQAMYKRNEYRKRDPLDVVAEMKYLVRDLKFKAIYFDDCIFNADKSHVQALCQQIIKSKLEIPWAAMARPDLMDEQMIKMMAEAGLYAIKYGIESADQTILNLCRKDLDLSKAEKIIQQTKQNGIKTHLTFCLGLPGETEQTVKRTEEFIKKIQPDSYQISLATPFPGTEYFNTATQNNWLCSNDFSEYDGNCKSIVRTQALSSADIERMKFALDNNLNT